MKTSYYVTTISCIPYGSSVVTNNIKLLQVTTSYYKVKATFQIMIGKCL